MRRTSSHCLLPRCSWSSARSHAVPAVARAMHHYHVTVHTYMSTYSSANTRLLHDLLINVLPLHSCRDMHVMTGIQLHIQRLLAAVCLHPLITVIGHCCKETHRYLGLQIAPWSAFCVSGRKNRKAAGLLAESCNQTSVPSTASCAAGADATFPLPCLRWVASSHSEPAGFEF